VRQPPPGDVAKLLDADVDQLARALALVAAAGSPAASRIGLCRRYDVRDGARGPPGRSVQAVVIHTELRGAPVFKIIQPCRRHHRIPVARKPAIEPLDFVPLQVIVRGVNRGGIAQADMVEV
jgi:hypothetical protein